MKLLFDHNLSPKLVGRLADLFPKSAHVFPLNLYNVPDKQVWDHARDNGFVMVSKDADFNELSLLHGYPPKLIWLRIGNCTTEEIEQLLRANFEAIEAMNANAQAGVLSLF